MNGRVYDPNLGRVLSVDPVFQFPTNTQSLNHYSYVLNNPLSLTDPTGYTTGSFAWVCIDELGCIGNGGGNRDAKGNLIKNNDNANGGSNGEKNNKQQKDQDQHQDTQAGDAGKGDPKEVSQQSTDPKMTPESQSKTAPDSKTAQKQTDPHAASTPTQRLTYNQIHKLVHDNNQSGQSDELITAVAWKESRFDPNAKSSDPTSTATGLMQITKYADKDLVKLKGSAYSWDKITDPKNPAINIRAGSLYLGLRIQWSGGDVTKGLNCYGTGTGYATNILKAESDLKLGPKNPQQVLINDIGKP